jgi:hypothetical protein
MSPVESLTILRLSPLEKAGGRFVLCFGETELGMVWILWRWVRDSWGYVFRLALTGIKDGDFSAYSLTVYGLLKNVAMFLRINMADGKLLIGLPSALKDVLLHSPYLTLSPPPKTSTPEVWVLSFAGLKMDQR